MNIEIHCKRTVASAVLAFIILLGINCLGCGRLQDSAEKVSPNVTSSNSPPFGTKEPERYQATRTVTFTETRNDGSVKEWTTRALIARDGPQRREEYAVGTADAIVFLQIAAGRFVMLPRLKIYADAGEVDSEEANEKLSQLRTEAEMAAPDLLLNEPILTTEYQNLGAEVVADRKTTKYRVINRSGSGVVSTETLIWIDDVLSIPVASQYLSSNSNGSTRVSMELRDIMTEVDSRMFALPSDYRKVAASQILSAAGPTAARPGK